MTVVKFLLSLSVIVSLFAASASAQESGEAVVLEDGGVSITHAELAYLVGGWTPQMRDSAIQDPGDRLELLNLALANKRVAMEADKILEERPELYWEYITGLRGYQRNFVLARHRDSIEVPDFTELAREEYLVKKEKIAVNPEKRLSSHILFAAPPGIPRDDILVEAQGVLDQLRGGASFEEMVAAHSDEPNAAAKKGLFNYWMTYGDEKVSPPYSEALFKIGKVGEYSELTQTQFGVHIIRLDGIQEKTYKPFEEIKPQLIEAQEREYRALAMKDFLSQFQLSARALEETCPSESIKSSGGQHEPRQDGTTIKHLPAPRRAGSDHHPGPSRKAYRRHRPERKKKKKVFQYSNLHVNIEACASMLSCSNVGTFGNCITELMDASVRTKAATYFILHTCRLLVKDCVGKCV